MSMFETDSLEKLIAASVAAGAGTQLKRNVDNEIAQRLEALRKHGEGHAGIMAELDGRRLTFKEALDQLADEMERAGVADAHGRDLSEEEPHRKRADELRAMLEQRYSLLLAANSGCASLMDGGSKR